MNNKENEYVYALWKPFVFSSAKPRFYRISELPGHGFSSLYYVTKSQADLLSVEGTKGFKGCVWSERLWLDFDDQLSGRKALEEIRKCGYDYLCYTSGRRGLHVGLLRNTEPSHTLPWLDKVWKRKHFPDADDSIYAHLHLFRRPGDRHEETGKRKELLSSASTGIAIPSLEPEEIAESEQRLTAAQDAFMAGPNMENTRSIFDDLYIRQLTTPRSEGDRHPTLVKLAYALHRRGYDAGVASFWLSESNKLYPTPKPQSEIDKIVRDIYG
jgi:hypothetical protein